MAINDNYFVMPMNLDRVCRICLQENTNLSPIFCSGQNLGSHSDLSEKIQICGAVDCQEQDGFPSMICDVCIYKASVAHEFRQLCQLSDNRLRLYYNKPARFSNANDSGTQTNLQKQSQITKTAEELQNNYFVKEEAINNHQYRNTVSNEECREELIVSHNTSAVTTIEQSIPTVEVNMSIQQEKLFNCHIDFEQQKSNNNSLILQHNTQAVTCTQDLIPVTPNLIEDVCSIGPEINSVDNGVKESINYFTYISKEAEETEKEEKEEAEEVEEAEEEHIQSCHVENSVKKSKTLKNSHDKDGLDHTYFQTENDQTTEKKFKCEVCSEFYNNEKCFEEHQLTHEKQHKCEICFKTFYKLKNLEQHKIIHSKKPYACQICHVSFCKSNNLLKHLKTHPVKDKDSDEQVNSNDSIIKNNDVQNSKTEKDLVKETTNTNKDDDEFGNVPEIFKCEICGQYCSTLKNLKRHALIHGEKKYSCTVCKKWFFRADTLKKHAERHGHGLLDNLSDNNKLYESDDEMFPSNLNKQSSTNEKSKKIENEQEEKGNYKCQHCEKVLNSKKGLRRHVALHKPKPEPAVCEICKKVCASRARLTHHLKTHKPKEKVPRQYLCHICSKVYPSNSSLTYHMRTHSGVKPHVCKICNSGFTTTTSLANHIRIHTGDKPFVCHVCSAAFAVSSAFRRHLTRHTGEANYLCKTCGKAFKRLSTLKEHTYTHSGEKPYVCKTCGAAYSHSGSLFAHQKRCRAQFNDVVIEDTNHAIAHHIHVNNVQSGVRSLTVIGQMY